MKRTHIDDVGYFDLEYMCEHDNLECPEFFVLLQRLENDEIDIDEYINELTNLELTIRNKHPDKFNIGGLIF